MLNALLSSRKADPKNLLSTRCRTKLQTSTTDRSAPFVSKPMNYNNEKNILKNTRTRTVSSGQINQVMSPWKNKRIET